MRFVDEIVFESPVARVGRFRCAVSDSRFHYTGPTQNALVAFPRSAVIIRHAGSREFVADPTISTIYNVGQEYTRDAVSSDGDRSEWFAVRPRVAAEIVSRFDPRAADRQDRPYTHEFAAVDSQLYLDADIYQRRRHAARVLLPALARDDRYARGGRNDHQHRRGGAPARLRKATDGREASSK